MPPVDTTPRGVTVLDIHAGQWALWQVSVTTIEGPLRATSTNAVITDGFDEKAFLSLAYQRPVLLTARAALVCTEPMVHEAPQFDPESFIEKCRAWTDLLQEKFWAENDRRVALNAEKARDRKEAKAAGLHDPDPEYKRLAPLKDMDWPAAPPTGSWTTEGNSTEALNVEALRVANGCARLLNYWVEIEVERTNKRRTYFEGVGEPTVRRWPVPISSDVEEAMPLAV